MDTKKLLLTIALLLSIATSASAGELDKIWNLGRDNMSYGEFSAMPALNSMADYTAHDGGFDMKVGKKKLTGDFPGIQAGPVDGWGGFKAYPIRIHFLLKEVPAGGAVLTAGLMGVSPEIDAMLAADMNGTTKTVNIRRGSSRQVLEFPTGFGEARTKRFFFSPESLKEGVNTATLTVTKGSWIVYDYIRLEGVTTGDELVIDDLRISAPPFLVDMDGGEPGHPVRAAFFAIGGPVEGTLKVAGGGASVEKSVDIIQGEQTLTITYPEVEEETEITLTLEAGGIAEERNITLKPVRHMTISLIPCSHLDIGYPDLQPNVMLGQKQLLEYAADMINEPGNESKPPMTWVSETSWPVRHLLNGVGAYEFYGPWIDNVPMMRTVSKEFLKETNSMRSVSPLAHVRSSAGEGMAVNPRRAVDGSPMGWHTLGPASGAWIELQFDNPQPAAFVAVRGGREVDNRITKVKLTLTNDSAEKVFEAGPMGTLRERLLIDTGDFPAKTVKLEILEADNNNAPTAVMELEIWKRVPTEDINKQVINAIKSGGMEVTGLYLNFLTGLIPTEWLARSMARSNEVALKTGVPLTTAAITDVPGYSFALPDLLADAGIKYLYPAQNPHRAKPCRRDMPIAFYWTGPAGGRVLTYRAFNTYNEGYWLGFSRSADLVEELLPPFLEGLNDGSYPYDLLMLRLLGDITDDGPVAEIVPDIVKEWNSRWAWPKLVVDTPAKFFPVFEKKYGDIVPHMKGDWTGYWEDGAGSTAKETGVIREVHRSLLGATAFAAFYERIIGPNPELRAELAAAEENLYLYDEHTWGADESVRKPDSERTASQWYLKEMPAWDALDRTEHAWKMMSPLFEKFAPAPARGGRTVCTVNSMGKSREDTAAVRLHKPEVDVTAYSPSGSSLDASGVYPAGERNYISIRESIPALGIKCVEIARGESGGSAAIQYSAPILENDFYRITFDEETGRITSVFDKELDAEILDSEKGFGMNEFLYVRGYEQDEPVRLSNVEVTPGESNSVFSEVVVTGSAPFVPEVKQVVRLHNLEKKIEFINHLKKTKTYEKEAGYFAFPLNVPDGKLRLEMTGGMMALEEDQLPGASRDWISMQDAAVAVGPEYSAVLAINEAPLVVTGKINILAYQEELDPADTTIFSYPFNNYWETNYKAGQGGEMTFSYALTSMPGTVKDSQAIEFAESGVTPLRAVDVKNPQGGATGESISFLSVKPRNVRLLGVKTAANGEGIIVRVQETDGAAADAEISFSQLLKITGAESTDLMEKKLSVLEILEGKNGMDSVKVPVSPLGIGTVMLK